MTELICIKEGEWLGDADNSAWEQLIENRGGCSCHISPPCGACSDPVAEEELNEVGYTYSAHGIKGGA